MKNDSEKTLVQIEKAYRINQKAMLGVAYKILHDATLAEDAVHNAMLKILQYPNNIDFDDEIKTRNYFARVVRNVSIDMLSKLKPDTSLDSDPTIILTAPDNSNPEQYTISNASVDIIIEEINKMDTKYSDVLKYLKGDKLTVVQTAELMCISKRTVSYRLEKARQLLKEKLRKADK